MFRRRTIPLGEPFLPSLARLLLDECRESLPEALVLLPATRACASLRHALLDGSGRDGLLLPRITTPKHLAEDLAARLAPPPDAGDPAPAADPPVPPRLRAALLAPRLADLAWVGGRAASGLAEELVREFDELRRAGLDPGSAEPAANAGELQERDLARLAEAWRRYREVSPRDHVDDELAVLDAAERAAEWLGFPIASLWAAGLSDVDAAQARLLSRAADAAADGAFWVATDASATPLARLYLAGWGDAGRPDHPSAPALRAEAMVAGKAPAADAGDTWRDRAAGLVPGEILHPDGSPLLLPCGDPEQESRTVADLVASALEADPDLDVTVATADRDLARRIGDQLVDMGLDFDDTGGLPLSELAVGRLAGQLIRASLTNLHHDPLLEVLTHPLADFGLPPGKHARRTLTFEREVVRDRLGGAGLAPLRRHAREADARHRRRHPDASPEREDLVDDLERAFRGLSAIGGREAPALEHVAALRAAWDAVAPGAPLSTDPGGEGGEGDERPVGADRLAALLDDLETVSPLLPPLTPAEFSALLARQMARIAVLAHRPQFLRVRLTGLLEARLEHAGFLIVAGLDEDVFPDRPRRALFLSTPWRLAHGLPDWRGDLGLDAELVLRLLHGGDRVVVTWSGEKDGQPRLPSPLLARLLVGLDAEPEPAPHVPLRRTEPIPGDVDARQDRFAAEPQERPPYRPPTRPDHVSVSSLNDWRRCPYRWLLARGFGLGETERLIEEIEPRQVGEIIHDAMRDWLRPGGAGANALAAGDRDAALGALHEAIAAGHERLGDTPARALWTASWDRIAGELVEIELADAAAWRPAAVEVEFSFALADLHAWLGAPDAPPLPREFGDVVCKGRIDRIDRDPGDPGRFRVIDYKTGTVPTKEAVQTGDEPQLAVYALASLLGAVDGLPAATTVVGGYYGLKAGKAGPGAKLPLAENHDLRRDARTCLESSLAVLAGRGPYPLIPGGPPPDHGGSPCRFCHLRGACRVDETHSVPADADATGGVA